MDNNKEVQTKSSTFSILRIIYRNLFLIILLVVVGFASGIVMGKLRVKPTYTARCAVMLATSLDPSSQNSNSASTDMSHAKIYLPTVRATVSAPVTIDRANSIYSGDDTIYTSNIRVTVDLQSDTCIFAISYSDASADAAKNKLESIIEAIDVVLNEQPVLSAGEANIIPLQSEYTVIVTESISKFVVLGTGIGIAAAVIIVLLKFAFDNKIKDVSELEEIVGAGVLTMLEKY